MKETIRKENIARKREWFKFGVPILALLKCCFKLEIITLLWADKTLYMELGLLLYKVSPLNKDKYINNITFLNIFQFYDLKFKVYFIVN